MKKVALVISILLATASCKRNITIDESVVSLKEFREIGELITAEYYGEVIAGLSQLNGQTVQKKIVSDYEYIKKEIDDASTTVDAAYDQQLEKINESVADIKQKRARSEKEQKKLERAERKIRRINRKKRKKLLKKLRKNESLESKETFKELSKATGQNKRELISTIQTEELATLSATQDFKKHKEKMLKKKNDKQELIYLGRGAVKAGYDLTKVKNENILFSNQMDTIYIVDVDPELLNIDINPWFYFPDIVSDSNAAPADSSLYGFQLLMESKAKNIALSDIVRVKSECKNLLRKEALDRNIYEKARENAEQALEGFFSLMSLAQGQKVTKVIVSHSKYFYDKADYLYDRTIDEAEYEDIKLLAADDLAELDSTYYGYQSLDYQIQLLDKYIIDLYTQSLGKDNYVLWSNWAQNYFTKRKIDIAEHIEL